MSARFRHEDVAAVPSGWKVRTVKAGSHRVRVAFPPGRKQKGSGRLVSVLHPLAGSNPCANPCNLRAANPAELMVMSANNPPRGRRNPGGFELKRAARLRAKQIREASGRNPKMVHGLHIKYSPVNSAYFLMWHGTILRIFPTKKEAKAEMDYLLRTSSPQSNPPTFSFNPENSGVSRYAVYKDNVLFEVKRSLADADRLAARLRNQGHAAQVVGPRQFFNHKLGENPAELLIMGANPASEPTVKRLIDIYQDLRSGGMDHSDAIGETLTRYSVGDEDRQEFKRRVSRAGGRLWAGANPRVEVVSSPNPPTEEIVEEFTGREVEYMDVYNEPHMPRGRYAKLGPLIALYIKPAKGGQVQRIGAAEAVGHDFPAAWGGKPPLVVCDSSARQIYFVDGAQDVSAALAAFGAIDRGNGIVELGKGRRIDYQCRKEHVASPDEDLWKHEHGEENGELPTVLFDTRTKRLLYEGGDYRIEGPWIRN